MNGGPILTHSLTSTLFAQWLSEIWLIRMG